MTTTTAAEAATTTQLSHQQHFLDGSTHLYGPSVRNLLFLLNAKNGQFSLWKSSGQSNFDIAECAEFF